MAKRKSYHVLYHSQKTGGHWYVNCGTKKLPGNHSLKGGAIAAAKKLAKQNKPSELLVHKRNGAIGYRSTFGKDPFPPKG